MRNEGLEMDYLLPFQRAMGKRYEKVLPFFHSACGGKRSAGIALGIAMKILLAKKIVMKSPTFRKRQKK